MYPLLAFAFLIGPLSAWAGGPWKDSEILSRAHSDYAKGDDSSCVARLDSLADTEGGYVIKNPWSATAYFRRSNWVKAEWLYGVKLRHRKMKTRDDLGLLDTLLHLDAKAGNGNRIVLLQHMVSIDKEFKNRLVLLAKAEFGSGMYKEALAHFSAWAENHDLDSIDAKAYYQAADSLRDTLQMGKALRMRAIGYEKSGAIDRLMGMESMLAEESVRDKRLKAPLAAIYAKLGKTSLANDAWFELLINKSADRELLEKVLAYSERNQSPHLSSIYRFARKYFLTDKALMARFAVFFRKDPEVLELYRELAEQFPKDTGNLFSAVAAALSQKRFLEAEMFADLLVKAAPREKRAWDAFARAGEAGGNSQREILGLEREFRLDPGNAGLAYRMAMVYRASETPDRQSEFLAAAARLDTANAEYAREFGLFLLYRGHRRDAATSLQRAVDLGATTQLTLFGLASLYRDLGDAPESEKTLLTMIALKLENIRALLWLGEAEERRGRPDLASGWYTRAMTMAPSAIEVVEAMARSMAAQGRFQDAAKRLRETKGSLSDTGKELLVRCLSETGRMFDAIPVLEDLARRNPKVSTITLLARLYLALGNPDKAVSILNTPGIPGDTTVAWMLAIARSASVQKDEAIPILDSLSRSQPGNPLPAIQLATLYLQLGRPALAVPILSGPISEAPENSLARFLLGKAYLRTGRNPEAVEIFTAMERSGRARESARGYLGLAISDSFGVNGHAGTNLIRSIRAEPTFEALMHRNDLELQPIFTEGLDALSHGDFKHAEVAFAKVCRTPLKKWRAQGLYGLGLVEEKQEQWELARSRWKSSFALDRSSLVAKRLAESFLSSKELESGEKWARESIHGDTEASSGVDVLVDILIAGGRVEEGMNAVREALARFPRSCDAHIALSKVNYARSDFKEMKTSVFSAMDLCPENPSAHLYLALASAGLFDHDTAKKEFQEYLKRGGSAQKIPPAFRR